MSLILAADPTLGYWSEFKYAALGVALSVIMPFLAAIVAKYWPRNTTITDWGKVWDQTAPYIALGAFSITVALLVAAAADFETKELALLAGFAWDKTLQVAKITTTT